MNGRIDWAELFLSSTGRLARTPFLIVSAVLIGVAVLYEAIAGDVLRLLTGWLVYSALLYSGACVLSKRLHDRGRSGWWAALVLAAMVAVWPTPQHFLDFAFAIVLVWAIIELGVMGGEQGANRYGQPPLKAPAI
ncbi:DUF805 domain-containing protein [Caulobacter sp. D4A]|jgi:uncharacterized membrane protein YhaH (DUF805 family)|uniref:DUF805 domain-containing protein n=1 Tax=unclassified Caulobacter TaxID=2648921 RepID=UPI000D72976F|nr:MULTISPECIES: DUF805 domain-containing protein [unclassified Caulobacter]PXA82586.1 DUF805 domain-containing protein [Caulobacter sp. D4A]PXA87597.1 DUF805 domain-containing protein [Caulobacter sp. D5]